MALEKLENLNRPILSKEMELVIKHFPTKENPGPGEFYQTLRSELTPILLKLFQNIEEEGRLSHSFYEANITIPEPWKDITRREKLQASILYEYGC